MLIKVIDFAGGIDAKISPFVFKNILTTKGIKGTGLGLSIVKRLCDLLKIEVSVTSELNEGSEFKLCFSLAELK